MRSVYPADGLRLSRAEENGTRRAYNCVEPISSIIPSCWTLYFMTSSDKARKNGEKETNHLAGLASRHNYGLGRHGRKLHLVDSFGGVARLNYTIEVFGGWLQD